MCGDADGDGIVTTSDGVRILRVAAGDGACALDGCDLDGDDQVTTTDGVLALRRAAGLAIEDRCGTGAITGRLLVPPPATGARTEHEPNDGPGTAQVVGRIDPGSRLQIAGDVAPDDPFDGYAFVAGGSFALDLVLTFPAEPGIDLDLLIDDHRGGSATCESTIRGSEQCQVTMGAGAARTFDVAVAPASGSSPAPYVLTVVAARADAPAGLTPGAGAGPALDLEPAVYRGEAAPIVPGEIVVRLPPPREAPGSHGSGPSRRALAAAVTSATADVDDTVVTEMLAPDGTALLALPTSTMSALATAARDGADAKRARAEARAHTRAVATTLAARSGVLAAEPNRLVQAARVPRDPLYPQQWHYDAIGLPAAWDVTIGRSTAIVAVVDTGIRSDHPDVASRLVAGFDFISNPTRANDGDGIDPDPFDPGDRPASAAGGTFHGTHVAGTIAATTDNTIGVAGVTWRTAIMPLRVLGVGGGTLFDVAQAIRFAAGLPNASGAVPPTRADVINLSLTTSGNDPILRTAVDAAAEAGVLIVAAAGNTGRDGFLSPAAFPNVVSVAATDRIGDPARYSSFGATVDLAAPGGDTHRDRDADGRPDGILSTLLPGVEDYALFQGTSMASAQVSGVAALLLGVPGGASAARLRSLLLETAEDRGAPGRDDHYGAGIVDAARAVRSLAGLAPPPTPQLVLATSALGVAGDESAPRVPFRNAGGGTLVVTPSAVTTDDGAIWLGASVDGRALRVTIDRDVLAPGRYSGRVHLASNGGDADLAVVAEVAGSPPEDLGPVTVLLRALPSHAVVTTASTDAGQDYRYRFDAVPPGRYEILATTDRDGDGEVCDVGEECGAYPTRADRDTVVVLGGATVRARDFGLGTILVEDDGFR